MKNIKFKVSKFSKRDKIVITTLLTVALTVYLIIKISGYISINILYASEKLIEKENDYAIKNAFLAKSDLKIETNKLIEIIKNKNDEIIEVDFKIAECEKIMNFVVNNISMKTNQISENGYIMLIPLGYVTNSPILTNIGPKIPIKIETTDVVLGNIRTEIKEYGINNALVEIYIDLVMKINSSLPLNKKTLTLTYNSLIASKIINGTVPSFFSGRITKESETFNLPIK